MTALNQQKISNLNSKPSPELRREELIIIKAFSRLFKTDQQRFIDSVDLFYGSDLHLARIFECISKMKKEKLLTALLSLEYLSQDKDNKTIKDIMEG